MDNTLIAWLLSRERIDVSGHCVSWTNPDHPGYAYPEASALLLTFAASLPGTEERRRGLASALVRTPDAPFGVGRRGVAYAFDTAMAIRGLLRAGPEPEWFDTASQWGSLLVGWVAGRRSCDFQAPLRSETRWSESFGAHQSKLAGALVELRRHAAVGALPEVMVDDLDATLADLAEHTLRLQEPDGRFRIHEQSTYTYLHSHCYAIEGLLMQADSGQHWSEQIMAAACFLARVQQEDGSLLAWHDGTLASGPARADATAQAVRIFRLVDSSAFAGAIDAGMRSLEGMRSPEGGVYYESGSLDAAVWPTIFAAQALAPAGSSEAIRAGLDLV